MTPSFRTRDPASARAILVEALPIGAAVSAYGLSYGVLAVAAGMSPFAATLTSLVVLAGGSQFAFVGVLAAGGVPLAGAAAGLMVNARYLAFGFAIASHLPGGPRWRRLLDGYLVVDESVALALGRGEADRERRFRLAGWTVVVGWIGASAIGAYGGALIGDPRTYGLDAAFPAGFLALLAPWLRTRQGRVAALVGAGLALGLTPIAPPGLPIVAAALGAVAAMAIPPAPGDGAHSDPSLGHDGGAAEKAGGPTENAGGPIGDERHAAGPAETAGAGDGPPAGHEEGGPTGTAEGPSEPGTVSGGPTARTGRSAGTTDDSGERRR